MKQLNEKQLKEIKAGAGITGAFLSGLGSIAKGLSAPFKAMVEAPFNMINSIFGWVYAFNEGRKGHIKMSTKIGQSEISFDDSARVSASERVAVEQIKHGNADAKPGKIAVQPQTPVIHNLTSDLDVMGHDYQDDSYAIDDGFMHF